MLVWTWFAAWARFAYAGGGTVTGTVSPGAWVFVLGDGPRPDDAVVEVVQTGTQFSPDTSLAVVQGTRVVFRNAGPDIHEVYSLYQVSPFELASYPAPESRDTVLDTVGLVQVRCNIHATMRLDIMVVPNAWFTHADKAGLFTLSEVSAGQHTLVAWTPQSSARASVTIRSGAATAAVFSVDPP